MITVGICSGAIAVQFCLMVLLCIALLLCLWFAPSHPPLGSWWALVSRYIVSILIPH